MIHYTTRISFSASLLLVFLVSVSRLQAEEDSVFVSPEKQKAIILGGRLQVKSDYRNVLKGDKTETVEYSLRRFTLDASGGPLDALRYELSIHFETWRDYFGLDEAYIHWLPHPLFTIKAGQFRKPFSGEELTSTKTLLTVEKSLLYNDFLKRANGYIGFDPGISAGGSWRNELITYEIGIFQDIDRNNGYEGSPPESSEEDLRTFDLGLRLTCSPISWLLLETAIASKSAEGPDSRLHFNFAWMAGLTAAWQGARLQTEVALGDNHQGSNRMIVEGYTTFLAFYVMPSYRIALAREQALEIVLMWEGLDPGISKSKLNANDGRLRYSAGVNYHLCRMLSFQLGYSLLQAVTKVEAMRDPAHGIEVMARLGW